MPYIKQEDRQRLDPLINKLAKNVNLDQRAGELNYIINTLLLQLTGEGKYKDFNELVGAIEAAKLEFYRRKISQYEDKKIKENGDLPGLN